MGGGGVGIAGRLGINFGKGQPAAAAGGMVNPFATPSDGPADHVTLLALVILEAMLVGWLRVSFKHNFGG